MPTRALTNVNYLVDQDGSSSFTFDKVLDLKLPIASANWQMKWDAGVHGKFIWEASIYPDPYCWEALVSCEPVELEIEPGELSGIVSLPHTWLTVGFIRWRFEAIGSSSGLIQSAIRIVPI